jgi:hypothetical protein
MKNKIKKGSIVVALTLVIWTWAYQKSEQPLDALGAIKVSRAIDKSLLVTFDGYLLEEFKVTLKGPASEIKDFRDELDKGLEKLEFVFNAENENMDTPGTYSLDVLKFLENSDKIRKRGLTVKSTGIKTIKVIVKQLKEMPMAIQCIDENGSSFLYESITPSLVNMFVHSHWETGVQKAYLVLNPQDKVNARKAPIELFPYVELLPGVRRHADDPVKVKLPSTETPLTDQVLTGSSIAIGYVFSSQTQGKYDVQLTNEQDLIKITQLKATEEAIAAYTAQQYQILIEIKDSDINQELVSRDVIYNLPLSYVAKNEISPPGNISTATFKLVLKTGTPAQK